MKPCTQCGTSNPDEAKFCRQCGTPFAYANPVSANPVSANPVSAGPIPAGPAPAQAPAEVKPLISPEMKNEARVFGDWLKTFFLRPNEVGGGKPWYASVVIIASTLFSALAATNVISHSGSAVLNGIPFVDSYTISSAVNEAAPSMFLVLWALFTVYVYGALLVLRLMRSLMGDTVTFRTLHDDYAHRLAPWLVLFALSAMFALIHADMPALVLWALAVVTQSMWMTVLVYEGENHRALDTQWMKFLCMVLQLVLSVVIFMVLIMVLSAIIGAVVAGMMHDVLY